MVRSENKIQSEAKKYKGVRMRSWGSWVSEIRAPNQKTRIWLGSYSTPEAAARAYDAALLCLRGNLVNLNFPTSSHYNHLPCDTILSPKSIQRVAAAAANNSTSTPPPSPPLPPPSSSISSPSFSYSPSNHIGDDVDISLVSPLYEPQMSLVTPWYNFDSPKYNDMMHNGAIFDPPVMDDAFEEGDIQLWSFC
ncbi:Ethylene-responsive transcription factor [Actinidia chinensis var. chinensis]|uniref:Ethylene-responsive transcription factor n=1 Tax=Actinidia chinensis var. chinensis TaxID=1590841 RepID=A0A2R6R3U9_ACTCC|nr:Ethylene-responsive transcription factor [Actinidia chinensis var. chinensis]